MKMYEFILSKLFYETFMSRVWYLIVSIPDLCALTYFYRQLKYPTLHYEPLKVVWPNCDHGIGQHTKF